MRLQLPTVIFGTVGFFTAAICRSIIRWDFNGDPGVVLLVVLFCLIAIVGNCYLLWKAIKTINTSSPQLLDDDDDYGWKLLPPWYDRGGLWPPIWNFISLGFGMLLYLAIIQ